MRGESTRRSRAAGSSERVYARVLERIEAYEGRARTAALQPDSAGAVAGRVGFAGAPPRAAAALLLAAVSARWLRWRVGRLARAGCRATASAGDAPEVSAAAPSRAGRSTWCSAPDATAERIHAALRAIGGEIVSGPTQLGVYRVRLAPTARRAARAAHGAARRRSGCGELRRAGASLGAAACPRAGWPRRRPAGAAGGPRARRADVRRDAALRAPSRRFATAPRRSCSPAPSPGVAPPEPRRRDRDAAAARRDRTARRRPARRCSRCRRTPPAGCPPTSSSRPARASRTRTGARCCARRWRAWSVRPSSTPAALVPGLPATAAVVPNSVYADRRRSRSRRRREPAAAPIRTGRSSTGSISSASTARARISNGAGVRVALLDSAPARASRSRASRARAARGRTRAARGAHGTLIAGVVAAVAHNGFGIAGWRRARALVAVPVCTPQGGVRVATAACSTTCCAASTAPTSARRAS